MQQSRNPAENLQRLRAQRGNDSSLPNIIPDEVRITVLRSSPRSSPWSLVEKKNIAIEVVKLAKQIKKDIGDINIANRTDMLTIFDEILKQYSSKKKSGT